MAPLVDQEDISSFDEDWSSRSEHIFEMPLPLHHIQTDFPFLLFLAILELFPRRFYPKLYIISNNLIFLLIYRLYNTVYYPNIQYI